MEKVLELDVVRRPSLGITRGRNFSSIGPLLPVGWRNWLAMDLSMITGDNMESWESCFDD